MWTYEAKNILVVVGVGGALVAGAGVLDSITPHGTAAENQRMLCDYKQKCEKFANARQVCATAGNFDTCMSIKSDDYTLTKDMCTDDGNFAESNAMPGNLACNYQRVVDTIFRPARQK
jgi:hypothetical protein